MKKITAFITLCAFLFNIVGGDILFGTSAWAVQNIVLDQASVPHDSEDQLMPRELNVSTFRLPESLGTVRDLWTAMNDEQRIVIHIQDAHCNYYCQQQIAGIIEYLNRHYGVGSVNLEGGAEDYDLSIFTDITDPAIREKICGHFVNAGLVNGAEYFAVQNPDKVKLWGVEDTGLYIQNLKVYRGSLKYKDETDRAIRNLSSTLACLKMKIYSKDLLELDGKYIKYKAGNMEFKEYITFLISLAMKRNADINKFPNIKLLSETLRSESGIDFKKADAERDTVINILENKSSQNALKELVEKTVAFKTEKISQKDFYAYIMGRAVQANLNRKEFAELEKYAGYISEYDRIDKDRIMDELASLEQEVKESLFTNSKEKELDKLSKNLALTRNIFAISLTRSDYEYYLGNKDGFETRNYLNFIRQEAPALGIEAKIDESVMGLDGRIREMASFYEWSFRRDEAFIRKIKFSSKVPGPQGARAGAGKSQKSKLNTKNSSEAAIIVTGGFHTENLCGLFKKQGISYISIMPTFKSCDGYESPYFKILSGREDILLKDAVPAMLASSIAAPDQLSPKLFAEVREKLGRADTLAENVKPPKTGGDKFRVVSKDNVLSDRIEPLLKYNRSLIVTENTDAMDQALMIKARERRVRYLRLTLENQKELERLLTRKHVENGKSKTLPGELKTILEEGGILLIDYKGSDPQFFDQLNSLFDKKPRFGGVNTVSSGLTIVGTIGSEQYDEVDSTFRSRFKATDFISAEYKDPINRLADTTRKPPAGTEEITVYNSPQAIEKLMGRPGFDENGQIIIKEGKLAAAILANRPVLIRGDIWQNKEFQRLLRKLIFTGKAVINGEIKNIPPDFNVYAGTYNLLDGIENKVITASRETKPGDMPVWIINRGTQDILFSRTEIKDDMLTETKALLETGSVRIRISGKIEDWVWHQIMDSKCKVDIEIDPGCSVPSVYSSMVPKELKAPKPKAATKTWDAVKNGKVIYIETPDPGAVREKIYSESRAGDIVFFPVTPETTLSKTIASIKKSEDGKFGLEAKGVITALREGKTVILEGADTNPVLLADLATALCETPYLMENLPDNAELNTGRIDLKRLPGKLIITARPQTAVYVSAMNHVALTMTETEVKGLLMRKYPAAFKDEEFKKIMDLQKIFRTIDPNKTPGLEPHNFNLSFDRLCMLYRYSGDWVEAFDIAVLPEYQDYPEAAAFMRAMVRAKFESRPAAGMERRIDKTKLMDILGRITPGLNWSGFFWQLTETLSVDIIRESGIKSFDGRDDNIFDMIRKALIINSSGERKEFYKAIFKMSGDFNKKNVPTFLQAEARTPEEEIDQLALRIKKILTVSRAVFFRGPPSTGKSYMAEEIMPKQMLGFSEHDIVGPITTGIDAREGEIIGADSYDGKATFYKPGPVEQWIPEDPQRHGKLFIIDEANLTKPEFWNFLKGFFADDKNERYIWVNGRKRFFADGDRIIFTGNQESLAGRSNISLIRDFVPTVNFKPFGPEFIKTEFKNNYISPLKENREELAGVMAETHCIFDRMNPGLGFSLRDVQEFAARVNAMPGSKWTETDVAYDCIL